MWVRLLHHHAQILKASLELGAVCGKGVLAFLLPKDALCIIVFAWTEQMYILRVYNEPLCSASEEKESGLILGIN